MPDEAAVVPRGALTDRVEHDTRPYPARLRSAQAVQRNERGLVALEDGRPETLRRVVGEEGGDGAEEISGLTLPGRRVAVAHEVEDEAGEAVGVAACGALGRQEEGVREPEGQPPARALV